MKYIMEKYNLVVTDVKPVGEPDKYGNLAFSISFEGGKSGFFKCKEQNLFQVGEASEFYIDKVTGTTGKEYSKILRVSAVENNFDNSEKKSSTSGAGGGVSSKETSNMINRAVAVKAVCEYRAQSSRSIQDIIKEADQLFDYITFGITDEQSDGHKEALKTPVTVEPDQLPF